jgi:hypothetical protein
MLEIFNTGFSIKEFLQISLLLTPFLLGAGFLYYRVGIVGLKKLEEAE